MKRPLLRKVEERRGQETGFCFRAFLCDFSLFSFYFFSRGRNAGRSRGRNGMEWNGRDVCFGGKGREEGRVALIEFVGNGLVRREPDSLIFFFSMNMKKFLLNLILSASIFLLSQKFDAFCDIIVKINCWILDKINPRFRSRLKNRLVSQNSSLE